MYININYFGIKYIFYWPIIVSYKTEIKCAKGIIEAQEKSFGAILLGFNTVPHYSIYERSVWNVKGKIIFKGKAIFGAGSKIAVGEEGTMIIGSNLYVTAQSSFSCFNKVILGNNNLFSWDILLLDTDAHDIQNLNNADKIKSEIILENDIWIGCRVTLLKGTFIPKGCVIGSSSLVNNKFAFENSLIAGIPAKIVKREIVWDR